MDEAGGVRKGKKRRFLDQSNSLTPETAKFLLDQTGSVELGSARFLTRNAAGTANESADGHGSHLILDDLPPIG